MECMFAFMVGIVMGIIISNVVRIIFMADGKMMIDQTDPDKDLYKLEIKDLDIIPKKRTIILRVVIKTEDTLK